MTHHYMKWAEIDLDALQWNMRQIRSLVDQDVMLAAVVKANGYGHGALEITESLMEAGADMIVVSSVNEAVEMRKKYKKAQTLVLSAILEDEMEDAIRYGVIQTVTTENQARQISQKAQQIGMGASCHIKLDTGMNRIGFPTEEETVETILRISALPGIHINGMFTHFATADERDRGFTQLQCRRFQSVKKALEEKGLKIPVCHMANSAGILEYPESHEDMVRCGIITYGIYPSEAVRQDRILLKPAMSLKAKISHIKRMSETAGISYGLTDQVEKGSVIATVPVGYADGYMRCLSSKAEMIIRGQRAPIRGRVCMDQLMVDVTHIPGVGVGDEVVLFGTEGEETVSVTELAELAGTIPYELLCMIGRRVPRVYRREGETVRITNYLE